MRRNESQCKRIETGRSVFLERHPRNEHPSSGWITSFVLIPWIGTQQTQRILLIFSAASSLFILAPYVLKHRSWGTWAELWR